MRVYYDRDADVNLIKTKKAPAGNLAVAEAIKQRMGRLGRRINEIDAEISTSYDIIRRYQVIHDIDQETPTEIYAARQEELPRTQADWPARFRNRPSAVPPRMG